MITLANEIDEISPLYDSEGEDDSVHSQESSESSGDDLIDSAYRGRVIAERTIWVAATDHSPNFSVLYHEPPESVSDRFTEARALIGTGAKIVHLSWVGTAPDGDQLQLVEGRLTSRF